MTRTSSRIGIVCVVTALGACASTTPRSTSSPLTDETKSTLSEIEPPADAVLRGDVGWDPTLVTTDGARLTISLPGSRPYSADDLCSTAYSATVTETDDEVVVAVQMWSPPTSSELELPYGCSAEGYRRQVNVDLQKPIGDRELKRAAPGD